MDFQQSTFVQHNYGMVFQETEDDVSQSAKKNQIKRKRASRGGQFEDTGKSSMKEEGSSLSYEE